MTKSRIIAIIAIATSGAAVSLMLELQGQVEFRAGEARWQQQGDQLAELTEENQRLSNLLATADDNKTDDRLVELAKLRAEAEALKRQTNDLGRELDKRPVPKPAQPSSGSESESPEYKEQMYQLFQAAHGKSTEALYLATGFIEYAFDHQGQFPSNFDQVTNYLAQDHLVLTGSNQFEIVFHGSLDTLQGIPRGAVAVIRDPEILTGSNGKMVRVYGMADGSATTVPSDDNFQSWEAKHIIAPK